MFSIWRCGSFCAAFGDEIADGVDSLVRDSCSFQDVVDYKELLLLIWRGALAFLEIAHLEMVYLIWRCDCSFGDMVLFGNVYDYLELRV